VVPRHQHTAVDRNRLKRRLREIVRLELLPALRGRPPLDIAIRTRHDAYDAALDALRADVRAIYARVAVE
jgi:ribonuclease P protein component